MTGVSYMILFVVGGGILIAIAFLVGGIMWENPASQWFGNLGKVAFGIMVPALAGYIAFSVADRPAIAPGFIAGSIAATQGSGFIGAIIGGLAAGYFVAWMKKWPFPAFMRSLMSVLFIPLIATLFIGVVMVLLIGKPVAALNQAMTSVLNNMSTGSSVALAIIVGLMMAFDMGGPINKAAYTFGLAAIEAQNFYPIAAIMVAGMTPPLGIALAILFDKKKWTPEEQKGLSGLFVGAASFITEMAIPYAASDPLRVIPSLMVGSAVGAVACTLFKVSMMAPHGGLFVLPLASNPFLWVLSILLGGLATAAMLVLLKPEYKAED
jgi:PTS system fructose-specific IIC component